MGESVRELAQRGIYDGRSVKELGINFDQDYFVGTYLLGAQRAIVVAVLGGERSVAVLDDLTGLTPADIKEIEKTKAEVLQVYQKRFSKSSVEPQVDAAERINQIRDLARELTSLIKAFAPDNRERKLALMKLQDVVNLANASIAQEL